MDNKPVLLWYQPQYKIAAGSSWVSFSSVNLPTVSVRGKDRLAQLAEDLSFCLVAGNEGHRQLSASHRLTAFRDDVYLRHAGVLQPLKATQLEQLRSWLQFACGLPSDDSLQVFLESSSGNRFVFRRKTGLPLELETGDPQRLCRELLAVASRETEELYTSECQVMALDDRDTFVLIGASGSCIPYVTLCDLAVIAVTIGGAQTGVAQEARSVSKLTNA